MACDSEDLRNFLCKEVVNNAGEKTPIDSLFQEGKYVGIYFSAHWCPPCRSFTPKLVEFYNKYKDSKNLEIIFVSSDREEAACKDYFGTMPWLHVPYSERETKEELSKQYNIKGIPTLLLFNGGDGSLITRDGRGSVMNDQEANHFPWRPLTLEQLFEGELLTGPSGEMVSCAEATKDKILGIYFSAHWCPPCKQFTPTLVDVYKKLKEKGKNFEVIFVTSDKSDEAFLEYYAEMPWLAVPYKDDKRRKSLTDHFDVQGIPTLIILDEDKDIITKYGRGAVAQDKTGESFPWIMEPLAPLNDATTTCINETPTLVYMTEGEEAEISRAKAALQDIAEKYRSEVKQAKKAKQKNIKDLIFLYEADESLELADSIRQFLGLEGSRPQVVLMDIPNGVKYVQVLQEENLTKEHMEELVEKYKKGELDFCTLR